MPRFDAVLFDCDGVLVDSESITNGVLRDMFEEMGWKLTLAECMAIFVGKTVKDEAALIQAQTGVAIDDTWITAFRERRNERLVRDLVPVRHAVESVAKVHALYQGRIACASGADLFKVNLQLQKCGLMRYFEGQVFSGHEMPRSKPFPDVYLAAAASLGVDAARCAVVEDTVTGATAGVAAGATVFGYSPPEAGHDAPQALMAAGVAAVFADMRELPALLARAAT